MDGLAKTRFSLNINQLLNDSYIDGYVIKFE